MPTTSQAVDAIARHIGLDHKRVRAVARMLTDSGRISAGGPGHAPEIDVWHAVDIIIGSALDVPLRAVSETVGEYRKLGLPGHDAPSMPASVASRYGSVGEELDTLAELAATGIAVPGVIVEITNSFAEITISEPGTDGSNPVTRRYRPAGALHSHWGHPGHRAAVSISGAAFASAIQEVFK